MLSAAQLVGSFLVVGVKWVKCRCYVLVSENSCLPSVTKSRDNDTSEFRGAGDNVMRFCLLPSIRVPSRSLFTFPFRD